MMTQFGFVLTSALLLFLEVSLWFSYGIGVATGAYFLAQFLPNIVVYDEPVLTQPFLREILLVGVSSGGGPVWEIFWPTTLPFLSLIILFGVLQRCVALQSFGQPVASSEHPIIGRIEIAMKGILCILVPLLTGLLLWYGLAFLLPFVSDVLRAVLVAAIAFFVMLASVFGFFPGEGETMMERGEGLSSMRWSENDLSL